jgi:hypothetical protein
MGVGNTFETGLTHGQFTRYGCMALARAGLIPKRKRYDLGLVDRPQYAFGMRSAAEEAKKLGYLGITAIEFGVAGGNGLITMEAHAAYVEREVGIHVAVVGFDSGSGLPAPKDYRDAPFLWAGGDFAMDQEKLQSRLTRAQLVLGDVAQTVIPFTERIDTSQPIGFVSFDLDYWSSTVAALDVFRQTPTCCLPRVWCYFDDVVAMIPDIGELLAIDQFNLESDHRKLRHPYALRTNIPFRPVWANQMFQAHFFDHPEYGTLLADTKDRELPLS